MRNKRLIICCACGVEFYVHNDDPVPQRCTNGHSMYTTETVISKFLRRIGKLEEACMSVLEALDWTEPPKDWDEMTKFYGDAVNVVAECREALK